MAFLVYKFYKAGNLGTMMFPVIVYITALSLVVFFSFNSAMRTGDTASYLAAAGQFYSTYLMPYSDGRNL